MMSKLGFLTCLLQLIMKCLSTVRFSVKVIRSFLEPFHPSRVIRQGHPISPILFLFCA
jgi:hypothetical protein